MVLGLEPFRTWVLEEFNHHLGSVLLLCPALRLIVPDWETTQLKLWFSKLKTFQASVTSKILHIDGDYYRPVTFDT